MKSEQNPMGAGRPHGRGEIRTMIVREKMEEMGYDPIVSLVEVAKNEDNPLDIKVSCHKELAKYYAPQLKAVDINANVEGSLNINIIKFSDMNEDD